MILTTHHCREIKEAYSPQNLHIMYKRQYQNIPNFYDIIFSNAKARTIKQLKAAQVQLMIDINFPETRKQQTETERETESAHDETKGKAGFKRGMRRLS
ncbi:hypothetical protein WN944_015761 [Citrus x changshan-huyou]|uniref:Uncharacterized protein n=1 Tax=Citrus x changshan-huyou TaxID=2935761 RepID=A0AAP0MAS6_9ROSI